MNIEAPAITLLQGRPLVTLVVPCHGEGRYLDDCLRSLRSQHYRWLEIIVIDDAGPDDSAAVAAEHALADPRVVVVRLRRNVGLGAVRNYGLRAARGELVGFVDGDDLLPTASVSARVRALADHLRDPAFASVPVAGVYGDWDYVAPAVDEHVPTGGSRELVAIDLAASAGGNVFIVSAPLVRTDVLRATGGFAEAVAGGEDHIAWMRVLAAGAVFVPCREVVAHYRQKPISMVRTSVTEYAALTAASRRELHHESAEAHRAEPIELIELAAGEHTISFGVIEEQRPAMAARAPAATPAPLPPAEATQDGTYWPEKAPVGPGDGSGPRMRIAFGESLLRSPEPSRRPDADVIVSHSGGLSVSEWPGDADGPLQRALPPHDGPAARRMTIRASSSLGGVVAMAAALVFDDGPTDGPGDRGEKASTLILSASARRAALAAAASWGRLPSACEIVETAKTSAGMHLEVRDRSAAEGTDDAALGFVVAAEDHEDVDGVNGAALVSERTRATTGRSAVLVVLSGPHIDVEALRALLGHAVVAATAGVTSGTAVATTVAAGNARAARILADRGVAVRVASLGDLTGAEHVVTDDRDIASLAVALGTAATILRPDATTTTVTARRAPAAGADTASARLLQLAGTSAPRRFGKGPSHEKPPQPR